MTRIFVTHASTCISIILIAFVNEAFNLLVDNLFLLIGVKSSLWEVVKMSHRYVKISSTYFLYSTLFYI